MGKSFRYDPDDNSKRDFFKARKLEKRQKAEIREKSWLGFSPTEEGYEEEEGDEDEVLS